MDSTRVINLDELKKIQLGILDYVNDFCKANNIHYWIDGGTLLGAIRHKGYIPWDDDIDIGMLRTDYEKFMKCFNENADKRYRFKCWEDDHSFRYAYGKVMDMTTVLYEPDMATGLKEAVNIDVFAYDNLPDGKFRQKMMYTKRNVYRLMRSFQMNYTLHGSTAKIRIITLVRKALKPFLSRKPETYYVQKRIELAKKYQRAKTKFIGDFTASSEIVIDRSIFDDFVNVEFEGKMYPAPVGYETWLRGFYGDYMQLPPEEKRVSRHHFEAYYL